MENSEKLAALFKLLAQHRNRAQQGSAAWKSERMKNIGGSETGTVCCVNKYNSIFELISQKVGLSTFNGNINTMMGNIVEDLSKLVLTLWGGGDEMVSIMEAAGLPGLVPNHWYSPDGLLYTYNDILVLLEFKNAVRRVANGSIPIEYAPQVFCGLDAAQMTDHALFVDTVFRRCEFNRLDDSPQYDTRIHGQGKCGNPTWLCGVGFYMHEEKAAQRLSERWENEPRIQGNDLIDLGACSPTALESIFEAVVQGRGSANGRMKCWYSKPIPLVKFDLIDFTATAEMPREQDRAAVTSQAIANSRSALLNEFTQHCAEHDVVPIGFLPLKMFAMHVVKVERGDWKKWIRGVASKVDSIKICDPHYVAPDLNAPSFTEAYASTFANIASTLHKILALPQQERSAALGTIYGREEESEQIDADLPDADVMDELAAEMLADFDL